MKLSKRLMARARADQRGLVEFGPPMWLQSDAGRGGPGHPKEPTLFFSEYYNPGETWEVVAHIPVRGAA